MSYTTLRLLVLSALLRKPSPLQFTGHRWTKKMLLRGVWTMYESYAPASTSVLWLQSLDQESVQYSDSRLRIGWANEICEV